MKVNKILFGNDSEASKYGYVLTFGYHTNKTDKVVYNNLGMPSYFNFKDDDEAIDLSEMYLVKHYANKDKKHKNLFVIVANVKTNQVIKINRLTR